MEAQKDQLAARDVKADHSNDSEASQFNKLAAQKPPGLIVEFGDFLVHNKKWWLTPIVVILLAISLFIALTNTAIGPFVYVLF